MKVPAAKELKIISTISFVFYKTRPNAIPIGVARANLNNRVSPFFTSSSSKFFDIDIPSDIDAAVLCMTSPSIMLTHGAKSLVNPKAIPSNKAWVLRAINKTNDDRFIPSHHFFLYCF